MLRVKDRDGSPLGGYWFTEPTTKARIQAWNLGKLFVLVHQHRVANKVPLGPNIAYEVEEQICGERPHLCWEQPAPGGGPAINLFQMGGDFVKAMWRWGRAGFATVSGEVFEERKNTCLACEWWRGYHDYGIGYCGQCGCAAGKVSVKQWLATEKCPKGKWKQ